MLSEGLSVKFQSRLRSIAEAVMTTAVLAALFVAVALATSGGSKAARAAEAPRVVVKLGGKLQVPATAPLGVIATDFVLQQVLSQDFQVAGRLASASAPSQFTLTVTLTHRALEPGMSLNDVAPGDSNAVALLKQAGVSPAPLPGEEASGHNGASGTDDTTAAEGNSNTTNDVESYQQQGQVKQEPAPMRGPMPLPLTGWPVPPATAQERSALAPYMRQYQGVSQPPDAPSEREASAVYDTIFVARATGGNDGGELTVVAVAHPGFDPREVRKLVAEEIANAVLH